MTQLDLVKLENPPGGSTRVEMGCKSVYLLRCSYYILSKFFFKILPGRVFLQSGKK